MDKKTIIDYYSRDDVCKEIVRFSQGREVGGRYENGGYATRPNALFFPNDVKRMAQDGIVSFHTSVELWQNPITVDKRIGWDLLIDLDAEKFELSKKVAESLIEILNAHGVTSVFMKFSGRAGFHIFVPWKAFDKSLVDKFPEIPRAIGLYLQEYLNSDKTLSKEERNNVKIDSVAIASRHLMRAPYSINEKSGLVSIPVDSPFFDLAEARIENVKVKPFLLDAKPGEAMNLVDMSLDYSQKKQSRFEKKTTKIEIKNRITENFFSPSIKKMLEGLSDGRKRAEFIIRSYLSNIGWSWDEIENRLFEWNKLNRPPLKDSYIKGHISWSRRQKQKILPPNFNRDGFYKDMGIWTSECSTNKSPLSYTLKRYKFFLSQKKEEERLAKQKEKQTKKLVKQKSPDETKNE